MSDKWTPWKSKMTRAKKSAPQDVLDCFAAFLEYCETEGFPDWWHMMETSAMDAEWELMAQADTL